MVYGTSPRGAASNHAEGRGEREEGKEGKGQAASVGTPLDKKLLFRAERRNIKVFIEGIASEVTFLRVWVTETNFLDA